MIRWTREQPTHCAPGTRWWCDNRSFYSELYWTVNLDYLIMCHLWIDHMARCVARYFEKQSWLIAMYGTLMVVMLFFAVQYRVMLVLLHRQLSCNQVRLLLLQQPIIHQHTKHIKHHRLPHHSMLCQPEVRFETCIHLSTTVPLSEQVISSHLLKFSDKPMSVPLPTEM